MGNNIVKLKPETFASSDVFKMHVDDLVMNKKEFSIPLPTRTENKRRSIRAGHFANVQTLPTKVVPTMFIPKIYRDLKLGQDLGQGEGYYSSGEMYVEYPNGNPKYYLKLTGTHGLSDNTVPLSEEEFNTNIDNIFSILSLALLNYKN